MPVGREKTCINGVEVEQHRDYGMELNGHGQYGVDEDKTGLSGRCLLRHARPESAPWPDPMFMWLWLWPESIPMPMPMLPMSMMDGVLS